MTITYLAKLVIAGMAAFVIGWVLVSYLPEMQWGDALARAATEHRAEQ